MADPAFREVFRAWTRLTRILGVRGPRILTQVRANEQRIRRVARSGGPARRSGR